jgi:hypothetical protein
MKNLVSIILSALLVLLVGATTVAQSPARAAEPLDDLIVGSEGYYCFETLWVLAITDIDSVENAPATVTVQWGSVSEELPLTDFVDGFAYYATDKHLETYPTNINFSIYEDWNGETGIVYGPCLADITPTPTPTQTPTGPFTVTNLQFDHSTMQYSFNYSGYTLGDITDEAVTVHAADGSWSYQDSPAECTGGTTGSGTCSGIAGSIIYKGPIFTCVDVYVHINPRMIYAKSATMPNPDPACTGPMGFHSEYFSNRSLIGAPSIIRNEDTIDHEWGNGSPGSAIPANQFSARWTKTDTFDAGTYEFEVTADDGFKLYIDNSLVLDKWVDQAPTTYKVQKHMSNGQHTIRLEYYEAWGGATAKLQYGKVTLPETTTDYVAKFWNIANNGQVPTIPTTTPILQRIDTTIDFDWKDQKPSPDVNGEFFVAQWVKTAHFDAGTYKFTTVSDDGIRVYVDDQLVIDQWNDHGATTHTGEKVLTAGLHTVRVEYYEKWGDATAKMSFEKIADGPNPVPTEHYTAKFWNIPNNTAVPEIPTTAPVSTHKDIAINFDWKYQSAAAGINQDFFVGQWVKTSTFEAGAYTFETTSDDGIRVFIDNELILDQWNDHAATTHKVEKTMTAGNHTIRVEYYEKWGDAVAKFSYTKNVATPPVQPATSHKVYDEQLQNGWVNWSWDSVVDFTAELMPFSDTKHIKWNPNNHYAGLYLHNDAGFNTTGYKEITFAVRATKANQKMELLLLDNTNTDIGTPKKLTDYGGDPVVGEYKTYVIPLADLGGTNRVINGFILKDINGEMTNEIYVDSAGFIAQ